MAQRLWRGCLVCLLWCGTIGSVSADNETPEVKAAIQKGQAYLLSKLEGLSEGQKSLAAYALVKTGAATNDPRIQNAVDAAIKASEEHYSPGQPRYGHEFAYTVPCHIFLLEAADPEAHRETIAALAGYLVEHQQANGSWFYSAVPSEEACDTSQTQFALLGLWAANRAGVEIPNSTWQKSGEWLLTSQRSDGAFMYQPWSGATEAQRAAIISTTLSGVGSILVIRYIYYPSVPLGEKLAPPVNANDSSAKSKNKFGVLERLEDDQERESGGDFDIKVSAIDKCVVKSQKYTDQHFADQVLFQNYAFYAMERMAALLDTDLIGDHNWYDYASDILLRTQITDGSWSDHSGPVPATSFAILCLSRATAKILNRTPGKQVGGGLMAGARGLPDDLSKLQLKDGQAVERKSKGEVDDLLAELEKTQDVSIAEVQKTLLESVDLDQRDKLVGQLDRLKQLAVDPRADVRQTAIWAIGRSGEVRMAPLLIAALKDVNVDVIREASYGLTVLSRKPSGVTDEKGKLIAVEPLEGLEEDVSDEVRQAHLETWLAVILPAWNKWYSSVRPYEERDDRLQLQKKR